MRHGESEGNCDKSVNAVIPNHKVALTPRGHQQAKEAGVVLRDFLLQPCFNNKSGNSIRNPRLVMFYTSPYLRARQTCQNIVNQIKDVPEISYDINEEPRMREQDFGNFQSTPEGMEKIWTERAHYGHFFYRIPHGESAADVYDRVASFNETLFRQFQQEDFPNVLVLVTHGIWARVFLMKWFRWKYEEFESLRNIPHCQYLIMKRNLDTHKFTLKTRLLTWDDLDDEEMEELVVKETVDEVRFNSKNKLQNPDDLDVTYIIRAQKDAIRKARSKDHQIKEAFNRAVGSDCTNALSPATPLLLVFGIQGDVAAEARNLHILKLENGQIRPQSYHEEQRPHINGDNDRSKSHNGAENEHKGSTLNHIVYGKFAQENQSAVNSEVCLAREAQTTTT